MVLILFVYRGSIEVMEENFAVVISKVTHYCCADLAKTDAVSPACSYNVNDAGLDAVTPLFHHES